MGIKGMTDRGMGFPIIGKVRKGTKEGNQPIDLDYFRVLIDENEVDTISLFKEEYPEHPRELNIFLPFNEIDRVWDAWLKAFTFSRQIAVSDGQYMQYQVSTETGLPLIKNGRDVKTGERVPHMEIPGHTKKGDPLKWKASGKLLMIIPELRRAAYLVLYTTSVWDIIQLSDELRGIDYFTKGKLAGTKLLLKRRKQKVSCPKGDNPNERMLLDKWLCHIEIHPENVDANIRAYQALAMPTIEVPPQLESGVILEGNDDEDEDIKPEDFGQPPEPPDNFVEGEYDALNPPHPMDEEEAAYHEARKQYDPEKFDVMVDRETGVIITGEIDASKPIAGQKLVNVEVIDEAENLGGEVTELEKPPTEDEKAQFPVDRPYPPQVVKEKIDALINGHFKEYRGKDLNAQQKSLLRLTLTLCFTGRDPKIVQDCYKDVLEYLTGARSTSNKNLDYATFKAIKDGWIKLKRFSPDDPYYIDDDYAIEEAKAIVKEVAAGAGQKELDI